MSNHTIATNVCDIVPGIFVYNEHDGVVTFIDTVIAVDELVDEGFRRIIVLEIQIDHNHMTTSTKLNTYTWRADKKFWDDGHIIFPDSK